MSGSDYTQYMHRALELAAKGWGKTSPNPMVGVVLVKNGKVVGEGYHKGPGLDHAEVAAFKAAGKNARGADLIVNLEPCCVYSRTPPCTDAVIKNGIKRVVYGIKDPNPNVNGKGLKALKKAGIDVVGPVLKEECSSLNRVYLHWVKTGKPYVISKVALSLDGKIAAKNGDSKWITGEKCRARMHYWRSGVDAVLVGAGTVRKDDPRLDARGVGNVRQPRPVVLTSKCGIDVNKKIWNRKPAPIVVCMDTARSGHLEKKGVDIISIKGRGGRLDWQEILKRLGEKGITSIFVEGGGDVHSQLFEKEITQYMVASLSTKLIGGDGCDWLPGWSAGSVRDAPKIKPDQIIVMDDNVIIEGEIVFKNCSH